MDEGKAKADRGPADEGQDIIDRVVAASSFADAKAGAKAEAKANKSVAAGESELSKMSAQLDDYRNKMLYLQADFENYRKRVEREKAEFKVYANESLIKDLIDVYENLERALDAAKMPDAQVSQLTRGLEMVYVQMKVVLGQYGLKPIDAIGKQFDPRTMEAVMQETSEEKEDDTVLEEFQRGYTLSSKVIRCAKVKVSKR